MIEHLVHIVISPISICNQFSDVLDMGTSEIILIFPWTWEKMLWGDTSRTGRFGAKVEPLMDGTPNEGTDST